MEDSTVINAYLLGNPITGLMAIYQHSPNILLSLKNSIEKENPIVAIPEYSMSNINIQVMLNQLNKDFMMQLLIYISN